MLQQGHIDPSILGENQGKVVLAHHVQITEPGIPKKRTFFQKITGKQPNPPGPIQQDRAGALLPERFNGENVSMRLSLADPDLDGNRMGLLGTRFIRR